jgi:dienelactone hydrolase
MSKHINNTWLIAVTLVTLSLNAFSMETFTPFDSASEVPQNPTDLWQDYDPRSEPLNVQVLKEWKEAGVVTRYITFKVGTFKGADSRIAAFYSFPDNGRKNAAFVWCHGGGQRAERARGVYFAKQGFATIDINWLGRPLTETIDENTDWGNVDPTQGPRFYSKALRKAWKRNLQPDAYSIDPVVSPRNSNWFLLVTAAKRAITFLEQQPEVNANQIGMAGFSMGGMITSLTAMDPRLKAVVPFVGGTGYKYLDFPGTIEGSSLRQHFKNLELYQNTVDASAYWPLVNCPVCFISSSNDFHSTFDRIYQSMALLKHRAWRVSSNIHENHQPGAEQWALLIQWFKLHLKGVNEEIPVTPPSTFEIDGQTAHFSVTPENHHQRLIDAEIYYSYDPNARTRFWTRADAAQSDGTWRVDLPIYTDLPFYIYASCRYSIGREVETLVGATSTVVVNSLEHMYVPPQVDLQALKRIHSGNTVIDDFSNGLQDWTVRPKGGIRTYKFQSPAVYRSNDQALLLRIDPAGRKLSLRLSTGSRFLQRQLNQGNFSLAIDVEGASSQDVIIERQQFKASSADKRTSAAVLDWSRVTSFDLSIIDRNTGQQIDLSSAPGLGMLKLISFVDVLR